MMMMMMIIMLLRRRAGMNERNLFLRVPVPSRILGAWLAFSAFRDAQNMRMLYRFDEMCEFNFSGSRRSINMHRAPARARRRVDLCAITHLLERRRIPLTEDGQRFRNCPWWKGGETKKRQKKKKKAFCKSITRRGSSPIIRSTDRIDPSKNPAFAL